MTNTELFAKPIEEITHDPFFRVDNFKDEKWYGDLKMFLSIGMCSTTKRKSDEMQKALKVLGYSSHTQEKDGKLFLLPGAERPRTTPPKDYER